MNGFWGGFEKAAGKVDKFLKKDHPLGHILAAQRFQKAVKATKAAPKPKK